MRPSYKGWKLHDAVVEIPAGEEPLRPSYKGWKHWTKVVTPADKFLCDLPIRDGNVRRNVDKAEMEAFATFL